MRGKSLTRQKREPQAGVRLGLVVVIASNLGLWTGRQGCRGGWGASRIGLIQRPYRAGAVQLHCTMVSAAYTSV